MFFASYKGLFNTVWMRGDFYTEAEARTWLRQVGHGGLGREEMPPGTSIRKVHHFKPLPSDRAGINDVCRCGEGEFTPAHPRPTRAA